MFKLIKSKFNSSSIQALVELYLILQRFEVYLIKESAEIDNGMR